MNTMGSTSRRQTSPWWVYAVLLSAVSAYYLFLLSNGSFKIFAPELLDRAFNSMLQNMLHGRFTVAREAIGSESFTRDGNTYSYFGVFPAFLRLFALPFTNLDNAPVARLSCLTAILVYVALQLRTLAVVHHSLPAASRSPTLLVIMVAATTLSGPQLYLLGSAWIFHEPIFWSAAMAAAFNLIVFSAMLNRGSLRGRDLSLLALLAGLAIHTRASVGVGLYLATALLTIWSAISWHLSGSDNRPWYRDLGRAASALPGMFVDKRLILPVVILGFFIIAAGYVNYERWGNPIAFADFRYYDFAHRQPHRLEVIRTYGELNLNRIWVSALYYATGIPYVLKGISPYADYLRAHFDGVEAPPITGLITNPLTIVLAGFGLRDLFRPSRLPRETAMVLKLTLVGHSATIVLILTAMYLALRYRFDFAPFMTMTAALGYRAASTALAHAAKARQRLMRSAALTLCVIGILASHYVLVIHKVWSQGVPMDVRQALLPFAPFARAALETDEQH